MTIIIDRDPADIHADLPSDQRDKGLFFLGFGVIDGNRHRLELSCRCLLTNFLPLVFHNPKT
jgi:hypothetical protein